MTSSHSHRRTAAATHSRRSHLRVWVAASAVAAVCVGPNAASAVSRTWTGIGSNDNWSTAINWTPIGAPINGQDQLFFDGTNRLTPNNDFAAGFRPLSLTFNAGAGPFVLTGNAI